MTVNASLIDAVQSFAPLAGCFLIAPLFLLSGVSKLAALAATIGMIAGSGLPLAPLGFAAAVPVEVAGGIALVAGYRARLVAAVMALFTIATAIAFHNNLSDQNRFFHFFKNMSIAGGLLKSWPLELDGSAATHASVDVGGEGDRAIPFPSTRAYIQTRFPI